MTSPIGNREDRRRAKKAGQVDDDGQPVAKKRQAPTAAAPQQSRAKDDRVGARQFLREVRQELRKVAWPSRKETLNYSVIVLSTLLAMTLLIFALDYLFSKGVLNLYDV